MLLKHIKKSPWLCVPLLFRSAAFSPGQWGPVLEKQVTFQSFGRVLPWRLWQFQFADGRSAQTIAIETPAKAEKSR